MRRPAGLPGATDATAPEAARPRPAGRVARRVAAALCWSYPVVLAGVWGLHAGLGDRWWAATLLLYGPRWVWGLPLVVLLPATPWLGRGAVRALLLAAALWIGPVLGFCVPWRTIGLGDPAAETLRVLSCNTHGEHLDPRALGDLIDRVGPDVVALQEWDDAHRPVVFRGPGWHVWAEGGLCLASRHPIRSTGWLGRDLLRWNGYVVRCRIDAPGGPIDLVNLHLETPREGLEAVRSGGLAGAPALGVNIVLRREVSAIAAELVEEQGRPDLVLGDFNLTPDSTIFRRSWSSYRDAFSEAGLGLGYTKYTRWHGARIDHVLAGPGWRPSWCGVGPDVGSDHRPLVADLIRPRVPAGPADAGQ